MSHLVTPVALLYLFSLHNLPILMNFGFGKSPSVTNHEEVENEIIINNNATPMNPKDTLIWVGMLELSAAMSPEFQTKTAIDFVVIVLGGALAVLVLVVGSICQWPDPARKKYLKISFKLICDGPAQNYLLFALIILLFLAYTIGNHLIESSQYHLEYWITFCLS